VMQSSQWQPSPPAAPRGPPKRRDPSPGACAANIIEPRALYEPTSALQERRPTFALVEHSFVSKTRQLWQPKCSSSRLLLHNSLSHQPSATMCRRL
jgi:hypothetical protein